VLAQIHCSLSIAGLHSAYWGWSNRRERKSGGGYGLPGLRQATNVDANRQGLRAAAGGPEWGAAVRKDVGIARLVELFLTIIKKFHHMTHG
jgi:hypothetical protein